MPPDQILLKGMEFYGYHGVHAAEKERGQRFIIDLTMERDARPAASSDDLADAVNYAAVYAAVRQITEGPSLNLLETLAETIATRILTDFDIRAITVSVKKPDVALSGPLDYAAVNIHRERN